MLPSLSRCACVGPPLALIFLNARLGHLFPCGPPPWVISCGLKDPVALGIPQILRKHTHMTLAQAISLSQTYGACGLPADFPGHLRSISLSIWVKLKWSSPTPGPLLVSQPL